MTKRTFKWESADLIDSSTGEVVIKCGDVVESPADVGVRVYSMLWSAAEGVGGDANVAVITAYHAAWKKLTTMAASEDYSSHESPVFIINALGEYDTGIHGALGIIGYLEELLEMLTYFFGDRTEAMAELKLIAGTASDELDRDIVRFMPTAQ